MQGYPGQPGFQPAFPPQPFNPVTSADLTALAQQGYAQQQATLQAMQSRPPLPSSSSSSSVSLPPAHLSTPQHAFTQMGGMGGQIPQISGAHMVPNMGGRPPGSIVAMQYAQAQAQNFGQQQGFAQGPGPGQGMKVRPAVPFRPTGQRITNESLKRHIPPNPIPQNGREHRGPNPLSVPNVKVDLTGPEPWADAVDEIDHRELAMQRFRARQEILSDIFGPERLKDTPLGGGDSWSDFGMDEETLLSKVDAIEKENEELERRLREGVSIAPTI